MSTLTLILAYSLRMLKREWRTFVLPFLSLLITAVVLSLMLFLTESGQTLLEEKARELTGGDININSSTPLDEDAIITTLGIQNITSSLTRELNLTISNGEKTTPISLTVVDNVYPLYGEVVLERTPYRTPDDTTILLDATARERLDIDMGDSVAVGKRTFVVRDTLVHEPTSLFAGFRFLPRAIMSEAGFDTLGLDPALLRIEYEYNYRVPTLTKELEERILAYAEREGLHLHLASNSHGGRQAGLGIVTDFLVLAVLITCVLAAVNVYASTLHLIRKERKSFALLLALGLKRNVIAAILGNALFLVAFIALTSGFALSVFLFDGIRAYVTGVFGVTLPTPPYTTPLLLTTLLLLTTALASFVPGIRSLFTLSPRRILIGDDTDESTTTVRTVFNVTLITLIPLFVLSSVLLQSVIDGLAALSIVLGIYLVIALLFSLALTFLYKKRTLFPFLLRSIVSHKKADGVFGVISFTSLFVALTALATLSLTHVALERYLREDLGASIPTTYVLDIQPSQEEMLRSEFPELTLFPNVGARIIEIDGRRIQDALARGGVEIDRELGREYNLTYRTELLSSEIIVSGETVMGKQGEISVDEEFAARAHIQLGSQISFLIQGFEVSGVVTSLRETDSRSGLPFFYFVLSPEDIEQFPRVSFGYAYFGDVEQTALGAFIGSNMPNASMIETESLRPQLESLLTTLLLLVLVITFPPLLVALLLIATLVVSNYTGRMRESARMRALGRTRSYVTMEYLTETISLTLFSSVVAYGVGVLVTWGLSFHYLQINTLVLFERELVLGLSLIVVIVGIIGAYLYLTDRTPLRDLLSYNDD
jgi:putative ABC transport system permease protein